MTLRVHGSTRKTPHGLQTVYFWLHTAQKGVPTKEIDTRTSKDEAKKYRALVVPTVLFLDKSDKELRRYEGESSDTIKSMKTDLDALASVKK